MCAERVRVALLLEHRMVIDTLTVWFRRKAPDLIRVVAAATPDTVLFGDTTSAPDVIITDQPPSLASLSPAVLSGHEGTRRVVVTGELPPVEEDSTDPVAYVTIADPPETLVEAVTAVTEGRSFVSVGARDLHRVKPAVPLTAKQQRVLGLYVEGLSVVEVAEQVGVTPHTVSSYLKRIRKKYRAAGIPVSTKIELRSALSRSGQLQSLSGHLGSDPSAGALEIFEILSGRGSGEAMIREPQQA